MNSREALSIEASARKHGIQDEDIRHAFEHPIRVFEIDDAFTMLVGAGTSALLLEIGVLDSRGRCPVIVHAMRARDRFLR